MADVKKFSGYQAADGTIFQTQKAAIDHTVEAKTKAALDNFVTSAQMESIDRDGHLCVRQRDMAEFLFDNRQQLLAAFDQQAVKRGPSRGRAAKKPPADSIPPNVIIQPLGIIQ